MPDIRNFTDRLHQVLAGRKKHPWGEKLGIGKGVIGDMFNGHIPTWESLVPVQLVENVSLSWLLEGKGRAYLVDVCTTDAEACAWLNRRLADEAGWQVYVVTDRDRYAIVLCQPATWQRAGGREIQYTAIEILVGAVGLNTVRRLREEDLDERQVFYTEFDADNTTALIAGQLGTHHLLGWRDRPGLLTGAERITDENEFDRKVTAELAATDNMEVGAISREERALIENYRALTDQDRTHARAVVDALATKDDSQKTGTETED